jgi:hypothetical protein
LHRGGHLDGRLVGHHVGEHLLGGDRIAGLDVPLDQLHLGDAFADVRDLHHMDRHLTPP